MIGLRDATEARQGKAGATFGGHARRAVSVAALLAAALLAGCSTGAPNAAPSTAVSIVPSATPAAPATVEPAAVRTPDLGKLRGLRSNELVALIGQPDFRRTEPPAELWQYRSADCVVDVFLYSDAGDYRVVHAEARDRSLLGSGAQHCLDGGSALNERVRQSRL